LTAITISTIAVPMKPIPIIREKEGEKLSDGDSAAVSDSVRSAAATVAEGAGGTPTSALALSLGITVNRSNNPVKRSR